MERRQETANSRAARFDVEFAHGGPCWITTIEHAPPRRLLHGASERGPALAGVPGFHRPRRKDRPGVSGRTRRGTLKRKRDRDGLRRRCLARRRSWQLDARLQQRYCPNHDGAVCRATAGGGCALHETLAGDHRPHDLGTLTPLTMQNENRARSPRHATPRHHTCTHLNAVPGASPAFRVAMGPCIRTSEPARPAGACTPPCWPAPSLQRSCS